MKPDEKPDRPDPKPTTPTPQGPPIRPADGEEGGQGQPPGTPVGPGKGGGG